MFQTRILTKIRIQLSSLCSQHFKTALPISTKFSKTHYLVMMILCKFILMIALTFLKGMKLLIYCKYVSIYQTASSQTSFDLKSLSFFLLNIFLHLNLIVFQSSLLVIGQDHSEGVNNGCSGVKPIFLFKHIFKNTHKSKPLYASEPLEAKNIHLIKVMSSYQQMKYQQL